MGVRTAANSLVKRTTFSSAINIFPTDVAKHDADSSISSNDNPTRPYSEIPGPKELPIIGNSWRFAPIIGKLNNPCRHIIDICISSRSYKFQNSTYLHRSNYVFLLVHQSYVDRHMCLRWRTNRFSFYSTVFGSEWMCWFVQHEWVHSPQLHTFAPEALTLSSKAK